jgi:hypothetical protein
MFLEQVSLSRAVLQVPQTMLFSDVMLVCAWFMNWDEYWVNNPKGRHCLNGSDSVMLV